MKSSMIEIIIVVGTYLAGAVFIWLVYIKARNDYKKEKNLKKK